MPSNWFRNKAKLSPSPMSASSIDTALLKRRWHLDLSLVQIRFFIPVKSDTEDLSSLGTIYLDK